MSTEGEVESIDRYCITLSWIYIVLSLLTYASSMSDERWSLLSSVGFRFSFIYFLLFIFFQNNGAYPFFYYLVQIPLEWMQSFAPWFGEQVLGTCKRLGLKSTCVMCRRYLLLYILGRASEGRTALPAVE